jgi:hypothetical protein
VQRPIRALATAGIFGAKVTGILDASALETTAPYEGYGHVTRKRQVTDTHGHVHEIKVTVYGWKPIGLIDAATKIPLAVKVGSIHAHEVLSMRTDLAGDARLHKVVFDRGFLDGVELWWLDQHGIPCVVLAKDHRAVRVEVQAQATVGEGATVGHRVHTVRHGQGKTAWTERLETEVVGMAELTTYDQNGTPEHGRYANRRNFQPNPINAVVVRKWHKRDDGPGGKQSS